MAAIAADRELLFGLLALQNGLIDQVQLVAAFQAWTRDRARPLAEHLVARGDLDPEQRIGVDAMVGLHLKKHGGAVERSLTAIPAGPSTRESLAALGDPQIERTLAHVGPGPDDDGDRTSTYAVGTATSDGQRFRVLRPHARGGLGAVFVALDEELHREVALKQILDQHADDPTSRARFLLEAEITGSLEHPGIVPVYGLGSYSDGRPFYAMRFIRGDSLKEAVNRFHADEATDRDAGRRSLELRKLLRRFTDVCNAIDYAHSRGVLHRDIKPGNIIVGQHGETLVVDWGLAKAVGRSEPGAGSGERMLVPSSASGSAETLPGSALGTPAYMSPEQADGDLNRLGPRSDVYSLGATLYYLLTGRPPLSGDLHDVIGAVRRGEFPSPRQIDAAIDGALEAVCLKAMAHRPDDRYSSPRALADDVERWMADEPVSAWREPFSRRARRWTKRHRTAVISAAVAMLAGVVGLSAVLVVQTRANAALAAANDELGRSKAAVQARYELAVEAIRTFHTGVSEDFLLKEEKFKSLRDRLLKSAADFYGRLGALLGRETDLVSRRALARSNFELADLTAEVGRNADALAAHRAVLAAREAMASAPGADAATQTEVGRSLIAVGALLQATGRADEALAFYRRSESLLAGPAGADASARAALAACRWHLGRSLSEMGRPAEALAAYGQARADQEATSAAHGATDEARGDLARTINGIGVLLHETGRRSEAEPEYRAALALYRKLAEDRPAVPDFRRSVANVRSNLGVLLKETGRPAEGEAEYREALAIRRELVRDNPGVQDFRGRLADSHHNLGLLLEESGRPEQAETEYREALAVRRELVEDNPAVTGLRSLLAGTHHNLAWLLWRRGRPAESEAEYREAVAIDRKLAQDHPGITRYRTDLEQVEDHLAWVLKRMGRLSQAEAEYRGALAICRELVRDHPDVADFRRRLAQVHTRLGWTVLEAGHPAAAEGDFRAALALYRKLAEEHPADPDYRDKAANLDNNLSVALRRLGRPPEARDHSERAVAAREALIREAPGTPGYRDGLAESLLNRGLARRATGDPAGAVDDLRRSAAMFDALPSRTDEQWFFSACALSAMAGLAGAPGSGLSAAEAAGEADAAMTRLRAAVAMGYAGVEALRHEDALDPLRDRDDFRLLMLDLAMPPDPFAGGERP